MLTLCAAETNPDLFSDDLWDVIVIGTGVGGSTIGHRLTQDGHRVLFIEKGKANFSVPELVVGEHEDPQTRLDAGYWPTRLTFELDGKEQRLFAPLGCGAGGTATLYAATLERFEPSDFDNTDRAPHPTNGWPIGWREFSPYYEEAERLYRVAGTPDPLSPQQQWILQAPPPASSIDDYFISTFSSAGLNPYRLHVGFKYKPGCKECAGRPCHEQCRSDARSICLEPALKSGYASIWTECEVLKIEADAQKIKSVLCRYKDKEYQLRGRFIVLAAGAYHSPAILLRSSNAEWPEGLANKTGLVGRNLMLHASEWFAVWPKRKADITGPRKTIGLRDFYTSDGARLGMLQSTGLTVGFGEIYTAFLTWLENSMLRRVSLMKPFLRISAKALAVFLGRATVFTMIIEDFPLADNRVLLSETDPVGIFIKYNIPEELRSRVLKARKLLKKAFRNLRVMPLYSDVRLNYGHPCGTCRFGHDPEKSVLDSSCRAHGLENLYIVDASFMPSSGGVNPSLTIAANALRVGDILSKRLRENNHSVGDPHYLRAS